MHADHHVGLLKLVSERDTAISLNMTERQIKDNLEDLKIYIIIPYFLHKWVAIGLKHLKHQELVQIIYTNELNPEQKKLYDIFSVAEVKRKPALFKAPKFDLTDSQVKQQKQEITQLLNSMESRFRDPVKQFYQMLRKDMGISRLFSVESLH